MRIPNHPTLLRELRLLERIPSRRGRDTVTHPRGCHDDYANVCFGALYSLASHLGAYADALAKATQWDNEPAQPMSYRELQAERRHRELLARYGQPLTFGSPPDEVIRAVRAAEGTTS